MGNDSSKGLLPSAEVEHDLVIAYNECKTDILELDDKSNCNNSYIFSMNPEMYNDEASQELLEAVINANNSERQLNLILERRPNPNTKNSLGKYVIEYIFEQEYYNLVIKMLKVGAILPRRILKRCMTGNITYIPWGTRDIKYYNASIMEASKNIERLTKDDLLKMLDSKRHRSFKSTDPYLNSPKFRLASITFFHKKLPLYKALLERCFNTYDDMSSHQYQPAPSLQKCDNLTYDDILSHQYQPAPSLRKYNDSIYQPIVPSLWKCDDTSYDDIDSSSNI